MRTSSTSRPAAASTPPASSRRATIKGLVEASPRHLVAAAAEVRAS
ncbi:hypothetical protein [Dactylosporangium darangshiense]